MTRTTDTMSAENTNVPAFTPKATAAPRNWMSTPPAAAPAVQASVRTS